jgi:hypothetical protein
MSATSITALQLKRLQVLYGQYERSSLDAEHGREGRLEWASRCLGRPIASFKEITLDEAIKLIDGLQRALGVALPQKPRPRQTRKQAEKAGTEGRYDQKHAETTLVGDADIRRIQRDLDALGWTQARLDAWLASSRGPNNRRVAIRTLGDANRVHWALKRMIVRAARPHEARHFSEEVPF